MEKQPGEDRRVAIGADHAGFALKERLVAALAQLGYEPLDFGTDSEESADYPDYGHAVSEAVEGGMCRLGVLVCGSGIGMSMTANRHAGIRAALAWNVELGELARRHNDANVLVLPARFITEASAVEVLKRFLLSPFDGGRHERRVSKIELSRQPG
ncbi:MAG: ribose 5-phosphate isomerase B [Gemmatimonadales bacterium]